MTDSTEYASVRYVKTFVKALRQSAPADDPPKLRAGLSASIVHAAMLDPNVCFLPLLAAELRVPLETVLDYLVGTRKPHDPMIPVVLASCADVLERFLIRLDSPPSNPYGHGC